MWASGVVVGGLGWAQDFCVVGCFDAQDLPDAIAVDSIEPVELGLCDGC